MSAFQLAKLTAAFHFVAQPAIVDSIDLLILAALDDSIMRLQLPLPLRFDVARKIVEKIVLREMM